MPIGAHVDILGLIKSSTAERSPRHSRYPSLPTCSNKRGRIVFPEIIPVPLPTSTEETKLLVGLKEWSQCFKNSNFCSSPHPTIVTAGKISIANFQLCVTTNRQCGSWTPNRREQRRGTVVEPVKFPLLHQVLFKSIPKLSLARQYFVDNSFPLQQYLYSFHSTEE